MAAIALLPLAVLGVKDADVVDRTMDKVVREDEFMDVGLSINNGKMLSTDADGTKRATVTYDRTAKAAVKGAGSANSMATEPEWVFLKVHFCRFWIPVGAYVEVCNKAKTECYKYSKWDDAYVTVNQAEGEDGANKFGSFTIDGRFLTVELVVPAETVADWDNDLHGVTVCKLEKGASMIFKPDSATGRDAAAQTTCGRNDKVDAVCHKERYPTEYRMSHNVARLYMGSSGGVCTAWRVSAGNLMMTNNHCFSQQYELASSELSFNYQRTTCGGWGAANAGTVKVRPGTLLRTSQALDYTLFTLDSHGWNTIRQWRGSGGETIGYFDLETRKPTVGEGIYIPMHGAGDPKQIAITDDRDPSGECKVKEARGTRAGYTCDSTGGSSGSPVVVRGSHKAIAIHNTGGSCSWTNGGQQMYYIWPEIKQFFSGVPPAPSPINPPPPPPVVAQDCQGYWGPCDADCQRRSYYVTSPAQNGGKCPPDSAYGSKPACAAGEDKCPAGCTSSCGGGKECGSDGCGGSCGYCYTGYTCSSTGMCKRDYVPPPPAPPAAPVGDGTPDCDSKACNYRIVQGASCPSGYQPLKRDSYDRVAGCATPEEECAYAFHDAIRARSTSDTWPRSYSYTKGVYGTYSSWRPSGCFVTQYSSGNEYVFWNSRAYSTGSYSNNYIICRKNYFYGPGCKDDTVSTCTPDCVGKQCGSDGCGGSCGTCNLGAGETCDAYGRCNAPTCGSKASLCAKPGLKVKPTKVCTKDYSTGEFCSEDECCEQRTCDDAKCSAGYSAFPNPGSTLCAECDGDGYTMDPPSCCVKDPVAGSCPPDQYSQRYCAHIVSLSYYYRRSFCNVPDDQYTRVCKTSCHKAGYRVCGAEIAAAVSLAASKGNEEAVAGGLGAPMGVAIVLCAGVAAVLIGLFVGRRFRHQPEPACEY